MAAFGGATGLDCDSLCCGDEVGDATVCIYLSICYLFAAEGIDVEVTGPGGYDVSGTTDASGRFCLDPAPTTTGTYTVTVTPPADSSLDNTSDTFSFDGSDQDVYINVPVKDGYTCCCVCKNTVSPYEVQVRPSEFTVTHGAGSGLIVVDEDLCEWSLVATYSATSPCDSGAVEIGFRLSCASDDSGNTIWTLQVQVGVCVGCDGSTPKYYPATGIGSFDCKVVFYIDVTVPCEAVDLEFDISHTSCPPGHTLGLPILGICNTPFDCFGPDPDPEPLDSFICSLFPITITV